MKKKLKFKKKMAAATFEEPSFPSGGKGKKPKHTEFKKAY